MTFTIFTDINTINTDQLGVVVRSERTITDDQAQKMAGVLVEGNWSNEVWEDVYFSPDRKLLIGLFSPQSSFNGPAYFKFINSPRARAALQMGGFHVDLWPACVTPTARIKE